MTPKLILCASLLGLLLASGTATADPKHCPPGHAKKGWCTPGATAVPPGRDRGQASERELDRAYEEGYRDGMRDAYRRGDRIPRDRYAIFDEYDRYGWPRPGEGERYVKVDDRIYLISVATGLVLDALLR